MAGRQVHYGSFQDFQAFLMTEPSLQQDMLNAGIRKGVTLITAVMNRSESLSETLPTWLMHDEIDEIVIVDWNSVPPVTLPPEFAGSDRIRLIRVEEEPRWVLSFAYNLAARMASHSELLKVDADVKVLPGFFEKHPLLPGRFYCGNWRIRRNDNEMHLNGIVYLDRDDFFTVNGYNEFIKFYGWDDSDLYLRLEGAGLTRHDFDLDTLYHIPHAGRTKFQNRPGHLASVPEEEQATLATFTNRRLAATFGIWTPDRPMSGFSLMESDKGHVTCHRTGGDPNPVPPEAVLDSETFAMRERIGMLDPSLSGELLANLDRGGLINIYNLLFRANYDEDARHQMDRIRENDRNELSL